MAASYAFAVGSVRAREGALLTRQEMEQLMAAGSERELADRLRDKGLGSPTERGGMDSILQEETARLWEYLWSVAPEKSLFEPFLLENDAHNAKAILKGTLSQRKTEHLLLAPSTLPPAVLRAAVEERKFTEAAGLPGWIARPLDRAYSLLAHDGDAQLADAAIDRAALAEMLAAAGRTGDPLVSRLVTLQVFYADVKIALRAARVKKGSLYLDEALCPCEGVERDAWIRAVRGGEEELLGLLERLDAFGSRAAAAAYRESAAAFEKWVDDRRMEEARQAKRVTLGPAPLVGYLLAKQAEIRALHRIASGIRTGLSEDEMRERGRLLYA